MEKRENTILNMKKDKIVECSNCINTSKNPSIIINNNGLCNVCENYRKNFKKNDLKKELAFLKTFIAGEKYDVMVGISGGKDSATTLYSIKEMGFTPLAFTFDIGYEKNLFLNKARAVAKSIGVDYKIIDIRKYISKNNKKSFEMMADLYDEKESVGLGEKFLQLYANGRKKYSTKNKESFPFVRPCQICRKIVIPAYYKEAIKHNVSVVVIGINEWTRLNNGSFSAIRKIQPNISKPPVYIVHLPFLLQKKLSDVKKAIKKINWKKPKKENLVATGAHACFLAEACEAKALRMLGFNLDSARLAREVTVGFITKKIAKKALKNPLKPRKTVRKVLQDAKII